MYNYCVLLLLLLLAGRMLALATPSVDNFFTITVIRPHALIFFICVTLLRILA